METYLRNIATDTSVPLVLKNYEKDWVFCQWNLEKWSSIFGSRDLPFRCMRKDFSSEEPCWERRCKVKSMTFEKFLETSSTSEEWMYFDYKYLNQWINAESELWKEITWERFGYPEKGATETTFWLGTEGAHTPAHRDTYGVNIVVQVHGKKRWILFPPEAGGLKPTRVPYEESSIYSELNFYCPSNIDNFKGLSGGRMVELSAGDALLVPRGWWHYVQNLDPINIALNVWLPHEKDNSERVSEALIKILVAQLCKDLPENTARLLLNPNEDDILDTPLAVLFLQLDSVAKSYLEARNKQRRFKRQKTTDDTPTAGGHEANNGETHAQHNVETELHIQEVAPVTSEDIIKTIKGNLEKYTRGKMGEDGVDSTAASLSLTKAVIDAFSETNVIELVRQNLFAKLS